MNIYELEKQTTPSPWVVAEESRTSGTSLWGGADGDIEVLGGNLWLEDMQFIAHCRNTFFKALQALTTRRDFLKTQRPSRYWGRADEASFQELVALIKELETVTP